MKRSMSYILLFSIFLFFNRCDGDPLFTYLKDNQIQVVVKGTYASNDPRPWGGISDDDDIGSYPSVNNSNLTRFYFDIAEIRANSDKFANYRKTFSTYLIDTDPFFDGRGLHYKNDDLFPDDKYDTLKVYIRKMIFNNTFQYDWTGSAWDAGSADATDVFYIDDDISGYDCNSRQIYTHYDDLRMDADDDYDPDNRIFPLKVPITPAFTFDHDYNYVIELRFVIKNFIKRYVYHEGTDDSDDRVSYYGMSDFIWDVNAGEKYIGGNVFAVARAYIPGRTATITGSAGGTNCYVVAIPDSDDISNYTISPQNRTDLGDYASNTAAWDSYNTEVRNLKIPPIATWVAGSGTYSLENVPEGSYNIYRATCSVGEIPTGFTQIATSITVSESDYGQTISL